MNLLPALRIIFCLLLVYAGLATYIALNAPPEVAEYLYSEAGPYEVFSVGLWFVLAPLALLNRSLSTRTRIIAGITALLLGARELDLHKSLFSTSFIKTSFYKSETIPFQDKVLGALLLITIIALILQLGMSFFRHLRQRGINDLPTLLLIIGLSLGVISKILDRFASQMLELFAIEVDMVTRQCVAALEESFEMALPLFFILALLLPTRQRRH